VRIHNDDLNSVDSLEAEAVSNSSDDLSYNSETFDFLMVYMPMIRPKVASSDEDEAVTASAKKGGANKDKKG